MSYKKRRKIKLSPREMEFMELISPYGYHNYFIKEVAELMGICYSYACEIKQNILRKKPNCQKIFDLKKSMRSDIRQAKKRFKVEDDTQYKDALDMALSLDQEIIIKGDSYTMYDVGGRFDEYGTFDEIKEQF